MSTASSSSRTFVALAILVSPLLVLACSQASSHPAEIGDCSGANCPPGQGQASASGSGGGGGTGTGEGGSTSGEGGGTGGEGGTTGDGGGTITDSGGGGGGGD